jgi:hypothetical protein
MEPVIVSKEDYEAGNYPKDVPIMVGMSVGMEGGSSMNTGKTNAKITIKIKTNDTEHRTTH